MFLKTLGRLSLGQSAFDHPKLLLLLAYLVLEGPKDRRFLAELFWPTAANHMNSLARALSDLRRVNADLVQADHQKASATLSSDVGELINHLDNSHYKQAITLYEAPFLQDFYVRNLGEELEEWIFATREYLAERVQLAALTLAEQQVRAGNLAEAVHYAELSYQVEGGASVEPETLKRLYPLLLQGKSRLLKQVRLEAEEYGLNFQDFVLETPQLPQMSQVVQSTIPGQSTIYIGREAEIAELNALLSSETTRLVTILGIGGVGKTRLAIEVFKRQVENSIFTDGLFFIALESITDISQLPEKIADSINLAIKPREDITTQLIQFLTDKAALLIFDNFEHLVEGSQLLSDLLSSSSSLVCLVTSRESLHLQGETLFELNGLAYPESPQSTMERALSYDAVRLFIERVLKINRSFKATEAITLDIIKLCQLLEGNPLALEMASTWVRAMPVNEILKELKTSFQNLNNQLINVPQRQQSIKATFDYSWSLLNPNEQSMLAKLSVFRGGFTREAARQVTDLTITQLMSLMDKSLLRKASRNRFDLHPLIHEFCKEKLGTNEDTRGTYQRHAQIYSEFAEIAEANLRGSEQAAWLDIAAIDHENIIEALKFYEQDHPERGLDLFVRLEYYWEIRGYYQLAVSWLEKFLSTDSASNPGLHAKATIVLGRIKFSQGHYDEAKSILQTSLDLSREMNDDKSLALALHVLGTVLIYQGQYDQAKHCLKESLGLKKKLDDRHGLAQTYNHLGLIESFKGNYSLAFSYYEESLTLFKNLGRQREIAATLNNLGLAATYQGRFSEAKKRFEESFVIKQQLGDQRGIALAHLNLGVLAKDQNMYIEARKELQQGLSLFRELGDQHNIATSLDNLGKVACHQTEFQEAVIYFQESLQLKKSLDDQRGLAEVLNDIAILFGMLMRFEICITLHAASAKSLKDLDVSLDSRSQQESEQIISQAREYMSKEDFDTSWNHGIQLQLETAIDKSLSLLDEEQIS